MSLIRKIGIVSAAAFTAAALASPAAALTLKDKKVTFIVPYKEGGGTDTMSRVFQPFLQKYLPGNPTVLVLNQPGGAGSKASNKFQREGRTDGTMIIAISSSALTAFAMKAKKVKYDILSWHPVILIPRGNIFYSNPKLSGIVGHGKDIGADIKKLRKTKGLVNGTKNPVDGGLRQTLAYALLGITHDTTFGLSTSKQRKAYNRGELSLNTDAIGPYNKKVKKYEKKGTVVPYMAYGYIDKTGKIVRDLSYPTLPTVGEAYEAINGKKPSGPLWEGYKNFVGVGINASKAIALPKGTSPEIVAMYQEAVLKIDKDPKFRKISEKRFGMLPRSFGKEAMDILRTATTVKPEVRAWLKKWLKNRYDVSI
jgi:tripartite-type tricarboxylate transporter receptor subunit TctC